MVWNRNFYSPPDPKRIFPLWNDHNFPTKISKIHRIFHDLCIHATILQLAKVSKNLLPGSPPYFQESSCHLPILSISWKTLAKYHVFKALSEFSKNVYWLNPSPHSSCSYLPYPVPIQIRLRCQLTTSSKRLFVHEIELESKI